MNPCVVTRDVGVFGEDVETFRPERWLRGQDEGEEEFAHRYRRMAEATDLMYGAGSRVCMGKHMAKVLMYKLFATLYTAFDVSSNLSGDMQGSRVVGANTDSRSN